MRICVRCSRWPPASPTTTTSASPAANLSPYTPDGIPLSREVETESTVRSSVLHCQDRRRRSRGLKRSLPFRPSSASADRPDLTSRRRRRAQARQSRLTRAAWSPPSAAAPRLGPGRCRRSRRLAKCREREPQATSRSSRASSHRSTTDSSWSNSTSSSGGDLPLQPS